MQVYRFYTGPVTVKDVCKALEAAGAPRTYDGTQTAYFSVPVNCPDTRGDALAFVRDLFPHAGYQVEGPLAHVSWEGLRA